MKSGFFWNWKAMAVLAGIPFVAAMLQGPMVSGGEEDDKSADTNVLNGQLMTPPLPADGVVVSVPPQPELAPPGTNTAKPSLPTMPGLKFTEASTGLVKLAQGAMDEDVMRAYVTNANSRFSLTPDQIIYLNDLGVPSGVVTSMIEHDAAFDAEVKRIAEENQTPVTMPADSLANYVATEPPPTQAQPVDFTDYTETAPVAYSTEDANYFYDSLAPYGSWVYMQGYGLCWQPTVYSRNHDWRPYSDRGRWLYTDCGWYWQSDYSWGWAPFHYGRWYCDTSRGWVWCPNRTWGPSWVSWRQSPGYCGWAPLPPWANYNLGLGFTYSGVSVGSGFEFGLSCGFYNFIPVEHLCDYTPARYCVGGPQVARVYQQTVVVNNVTTHNRQIFVRGIDPARVETASRTPVRRAVVESTPREAGSRNQTDRIERRGDSLVVVSPQLPVRGQRGAAATASAVRGSQAESVQLPSPRNSAGTTTGGRVSYSDRTRGNSSATVTIATPSASTPNGSRVQVRSRTETATPEVPASSVNLSGARGNGASPANTQNYGQRLYPPNRSAAETISTPSTATGFGGISRGNNGQTIFRDGSAQVSEPAMVPAASRDSTSFRVRVQQPNPVIVQQGPATPIRPGVFIGGPTTPGSSVPQGYNGSPETLSTPRNANQGQGQARGNFGSNLNRQGEALQPRDAVSRIAPSQYQGQSQVLVPSQSGVGSYSRGNSGYTAPAQNFYSPPVQQRTQPLPEQIYTPRSAPSAPAPAPAPAQRAPEVRSAPPPQQSAPTRSADPTPAPSVPSRGGR